MSNKSVFLKRCLGLGFAMVVAWSMLGACGGKSSAAGGTGSETNWLQRCTSSTECGEDRCMCGVCSRPCDSQSECGARAESRCVPGSSLDTCTGDPGTVSLCVTACSTECGSGFVCEDEICKPTVDTNIDDGGTDTERPVSIEACAEQGGEPLGLIGFFPNTLGDPNMDLTRNDPCPGSRTLIGTIPGTPGDPNGGLCCEIPPEMDPAQCSAADGNIVSDHGGGSSYVDGCAEGQIVVGWLTVCENPPCGEGGICCAGSNNTDNIPPLACRAECESDAGYCPVTLPLDSEQAVVAQAWGDSDACGNSILHAVIGACANGVEFVFHSTGHGTEARYFDGDQFLGVATQSDTRDPTCQGRSYWPEVVECDQPTVTEVLCGTTYAIGDVPSLPWLENGDSTNSVSLRECTSDPSTVAEWSCNADITSCVAVPLSSEGCPLPWGCGDLDAALAGAAVACSELGAMGAGRRGEGCGYVILEWSDSAPTGPARAFYDINTGALVGSWEFTSDVGGGDPRCSGSVPLDCYSWETFDLANEQDLCTDTDGGL